MFRKVLIVDDHATTNDAVNSILSNLGVQTIQKALYCDEANLKVQKAVLDNDPFDLIITDLSFKEDHRESTLTSGEDLVKKIRSTFPDLAIIVFSQEDHFQIVRTLVKKCGANAYVWKSREGNRELPRAIEAVYNGDLFVSRQLERALHQKETTEITDYDIQLVSLLANGYSKKEISSFFKSENILPSSISSIEKRQNKLQDQFGAANVTHLVTLMKDAKLI